MSSQSSASIPARRRATGWHNHGRGGRWPAIAAIVALHGLGLYAALQIGAVRETLEEAAPLFVSFIAAPPAPEVQAPPPKPEPVKPKHEPRLISTPQPSASPMQTPPQLICVPGQVTAQVEATQILPSRAQLVPSVPGAGLTELQSPDAPLYKAFRNRTAELGYQEGRNFGFEYASVHPTLESIRQPGSSPLHLSTKRRCRASFCRLG